LEKRLKEFKIVSLTTAILIFLFPVFSMGYAYPFNVIRSGNRYQDIIMYIINPAFFVFLYFSIKGSIRARLVLLNFYFFFLFVTFQVLGFYLSQFFINGDKYSTSRVLIFITLILVLTLISLFLLIQLIDIHHLKEKFFRKPPIKITTAFFIFAAVITLLNGVLGFVTVALENSNSEETIPNIVFQVNRIVYILPMYCTISILLYKDRQLGYMLAPGFLLFASINMLLDLHYGGYISVSDVLATLRLARVLEIYRLYYQYSNYVAILVFLFSLVLLYAFLKNIVKQPIKDKVDK
jgi:hypothetical protein